MMLRTEQEPTVMEIARQILQGRFLTKTLGGLFPDSMPISSVRDILEIACGVGAWSLEVGQAYPDKQVTGLDSNPLLLDYAEIQRIAQGWGNVRFRKVERLLPLDIAPRSTDLIGGRFLLTRIPQKNWPALLQECQRVLRPTGIITSTECIFMHSNSKALLTYYAYRSQVERLAHYLLPAVETDPQVSLHPQNP